MLNLDSLINTPIAADHELGLDEFILEVRLCDDPQILLNIFEQIKTNANELKQNNTKINPERLATLLDRIYDLLPAMPNVSIITTVQQCFGTIKVTAKEQLLLNESIDSNIFNNFLFFLKNKIENENIINSEDPQNTVDIIYSLSCIAIHKKLQNPVNINNLYEIINKLVNTNITADSMNIIIAGLMQFTHSNILSNDIDGEFLKDLVSVLPEKRNLRSLNITPIIYSLGQIAKLNHLVIQFDLKPLLQKIINDKDITCECLHGMFLGLGFLIKYDNFNIDRTTLKILLDIFIEKVFSQRNLKPYIISEAILSFGYMAKNVEFIFRAKYLNALLLKLNSHNLHPIHLEQTFYGLKCLASADILDNNFLDAFIVDMLLERLYLFTQRYRLESKAATTIIKLFSSLAYLVNNDYFGQIKFNTSYIQSTIKKLINQYNLTFNQTTSIIFSLGSFNAKNQLTFPIELELIDKLLTKLANDENTSFINVSMYLPEAVFGFGNLINENNYDLINHDYLSNIIQEIRIAITRDPENLGYFLLGCGELSKYHQISLNIDLNFLNFTIEAFEINYNSHEDITNILLGLGYLANNDKFFTVIPEDFVNILLNRFIGRGISDPHKAGKIILALGYLAKNNKLDCMISSRYINTIMQAIKDNPYVFTHECIINTVTGLHYLITSNKLLGDIDQDAIVSFIIKLCEFRKDQYRPQDIANAVFALGTIVNQTNLNHEYVNLLIDLSNAFPSYKYTTQDTTKLITGLSNINYTFNEALHLYNLNQLFNITINRSYIYHSEAIRLLKAYVSLKYVNNSNIEENIFNGIVKFLTHPIGQRYSNIDKNRINEILRVLQHYNEEKFNLLTSTFLTRTEEAETEEFSLPEVVNSPKFRLVSIKNFLEKTDPQELKFAIFNSSADRFISIFENISKYYLHQLIIEHLLNPIFLHLKFVQLRTFLDYLRNSCVLHDDTILTAVEALTLRKINKPQEIRDIIALQCELLDILISYHHENSNMDAIHYLTCYKSFINTNQEILLDDDTKEFSDNIIEPQIMFTLVSESASSSSAAQGSGFFANTAESATSATSIYQNRPGF